MLPRSVPSVQADHQLALLQHGTRLYLVNMAAISRDLFYQLLLTRWEALPVMHLAQPLHVGTLMELALKHEEAAGKWQVGSGVGSVEPLLCDVGEHVLLPDTAPACGNSDGVGYET